MNQTNDRTSWRESFITALNVLAEATASQPVGALDPALSGASALELYTGGLWPTCDVELLCVEPRPLMIGLFASGFRWVKRPRSVGRVLWHSELQIGVNLVERREPLGVAERANALAVAIDLTPTGRAQREPLSLKVVGVEDLIARQVGAWLRDGAGSGEAAAKLQTLVSLAREGVGGLLRVGYLQRRLSSETDGEVVFESLSAEAGRDPSPQLRRTSLTRMQVTIKVWCDRCGLSVVPRWSPRSKFSKDRAPRGVMRRERPNGGGGWGARMGDIIALDDALPGPSD
jgi:hypothetical protein